MFEKDVWEGGNKKKKISKNNVRRFNSEDLQLEKRREEEIKKKNKNHACFFLTLGASKIDQV